MSTRGEPDVTTAETVTPHVLEVVRSAQRELARLLQRRTEITRRMAEIRRILPGLAQIAGASSLEDSLFNALSYRRLNRHKGLTKACRLILREANAPLRAKTVAEEFQRKFPELAKPHKDLSASVTTIFHRLVDYGEARSFLDDEGYRVWQWIEKQKGSVPGPHES